MTTALTLATTIRIPPRPDALTQISNEINSADPDLNRIGPLLKKDVTLFGAILRLVNSPAIGFSDVKTIDRAIMLLGVRRIAQLVQVLALQQNLSANLKMSRFWDTAAEVAEIASTIARQLTGLSAEDAYATGMFHDFGIPLMVQAFPDFKELMMDANRNPSVSLDSMEVDRYGFSHYDVGYELGKLWEIPNYINLAIRYQPQFSEVMNDKIAMDDLDTVKSLMAILEIAKNISATHRKLWRSQNQQDISDINPLAYEYFDMSTSDFVDIRDHYLHEMAIRQ